MMKKIKFCVIALLMISLVLQSGQFVEAKGKVALSKSSVSVYVGKSATLKVKNTKAKVKWSSKNKKIAVVNSKGKVTGKKKGTTTIIAKVGKKKYKRKVVVKSIVVKNVISYAKPYQKSDIGDVYNGDDYFTMMGKKCYYGFVGEPCYNSWSI